MRASSANKEIVMPSESQQEAHWEEQCFFFLSNNMELACNMNCWSQQGLYEIFSHWSIIYPHPLISPVKSEISEATWFYAFPTTPTPFTFFWLETKQNFPKERVRFQNAMLLYHRDFFRISIWGIKVNQKRSRHEDTTYLSPSTTTFLCWL